MKYHLFFSFLSLLLLCGCGQKTPEGMPKLFPCMVTVTLDGKPLNEATVHMDPKEGKYMAFGITDTDGKVFPKTQGKYRGVAPGHYMVLIEKSRSSNPDWKPKNDLDNTPPPPLINYVDPDYADPLKTPYECDITTSRNEFTFEVKPPTTKATR